METSGRTAAGVDGGARADHNRFRSGDKSSGRMLRLSSSDPVAALAAVRPLVATGGERVQRPWVPESAADPGVIRGRQHAPSCRSRLNPRAPAAGARRSWYRAASLLVTMPSHLAHAPVAEVRVRKAERGDVDSLSELEQRVFTTDRLS